MPARINYKRYCTLEWCSNLLYAKGLCRNDYEKARRGTLVDPRLPVAKKICTFQPCGRPAKSKGYCQSHYSQQWRGEELRVLEGWRREDRGDERKCITCHEWKTRETEYYRTSRGTYQGECKYCMVMRSRRWHRAKRLREQGVNPDEVH